MTMAEGLAISGAARQPPGQTRTEKLTRRRGGAEGFSHRGYKEQKGRKG